MSMPMSATIAAMKLLNSPDFMTLSRLSACGQIVILLIDRGIRSIPGRLRRITDAVRGSRFDTVQMNPSALVIRDLVRRFGAVTAVNHLTFDVAAGALCGLLGRN